MKSKMTPAAKPRNYSDGRNFDYSKRNVDLSNAYVSVRYEDGTVIEPLSKHYGYLDEKRVLHVTLDKTNLVEAVIKSSDHKPLYTLKIVNEEFAFRKRSTAKPFDPKGQWTFTNPKRCIVLATKDKIVFYWDSGEIVEFDGWQDDAIYNQRDMTEVEV